MRHRPKALRGTTVPRTRKRWQALCKKCGLEIVTGHDGCWVHRAELELLTTVDFPPIQIAGEPD